MRRKYTKPPPDVPAIKFVPISDHYKEPAKSGQIKIRETVVRVAVAVRIYGGTTASFSPWPYCSPWL